MRDYAELITRLKQSDDNCNAECYECSGECLSSGCNIFSEAADAIEELLDELTTIRKQFPRWTSVEDELPKNAGQMCLVCAKNSFGQQSVFNAFTGYGDFNWYTYDTTKTRSRLDNNNAIALGWEITHWMPLPAPPKGVE